MSAAASTANADLKTGLYYVGVGTMCSVRDTNAVFGGSMGKKQALP
jgi:hypothetical protein